MKIIVTTMVWALLVTAGCTGEIAGTTAAPEPAVPASVPLTVEAVRPDGFDARAVIDGEEVRVELVTTETSERLVVSGREVYADWLLERDAEWVTGSLGGLPLDEAEYDAWATVLEGRAGVILGELAIQATAVVEASADPEDVVGRGLSTVAQMAALLEHRANDPADAPPPPDGVTVGEDGLSTVTEEAISCNTWSYVCGVFSAAGCWKIPGWWGLACGVGSVFVCGSVCSPDRYATYWVGNCNYFCQPYYGCRVNYCVGGGCSTCY